MQLKTKETLEIEDQLRKMCRKKRLYGCEEVTIGFYNSGHGNEICDFMTMDSKGIISDLQGPVLSAPSTAQHAEYFTTVVNFDYRIHPNWNLYLKGAYERAGIYKTNGHFEKGLYRTTWNAQACVEYFPMRNSELLLFAHFLYKGHHLARRAQALGGMSPDTQRVSIGLVYSIPVF